MADSLGTNPIVVDLTNTTDRIIKTGRVHVRGVKVSGSLGIGPGQISITELNSSGPKQFQFWSTGAGAATHDDFYETSVVLTDPFFNNISNRVWSAGSIMALYLD